MQHQPPASGGESASLLVPVGWQRSSCGYCKDTASGQRTPDSGASYYAQTSRLTVDHYQELVDRGWRRSGNLLYKQDLRRSCCPHYTIRLPAASFVPSKDQRQAVNRWNRHVLGEAYAKDAAKLHPKSKEQKAKDRSSFDLVHTVHESEWSNVKQPPQPAHEFEVNLEPDEFTEEKYLLFEDYQRNVHNEGPQDISRNGFRRFLCDSPLQRRSDNTGSTARRFGSFHQCYRLDGRLIAMAVLDLLPHCVSGVYFMYHDDFSKWSFGKISALREAALALEGGYQYYYMGFYIHSCVKMRYKGDYKPQHVLDPESLEWHPLEGELRQLLDRHKYISLSRLRRQETERNVEGAKEDDAEAAFPLLEESELPYASLAAAAKAIDDGVSLFDVEMPGVLTLQELENQVDLGTLKLSIRSNVVEMKVLSAWSPGQYDDADSVQGVIAELAACVGPNVAKEMVVKVG